jgi:hypothetical protein
MSIRGVFCALAAALSLGACTALPGGAHIEGYAGKGDQFDGLTTPLKSQRAGEPGVRYIFHIHGMGITDKKVFHAALYDLLAKGYAPTGSDDWRPAMLPTAVNVTAEGLDCRTPWVDHQHPREPTIPNPCHFASFGEYRVDRLRNAAGAEIRLYTYFWDRDLWRIQEPLLRADMHRHDGRPALLDSALKYNLLDGGMSDATAYVGPAGPMVLAGIESVLCAMSRDAVGLPPEPNVGRSLANCDDGKGGRGYAQPGPVGFDFVSHSLGSRMLFDALTGGSRPAEAADAQRADSARGMLIGRARTVFMAANQLPLLALRTVVLTPEGAPRPTAAAPPEHPGCRAQLALLRARCAIDAERSAARGPASAPQIEEGPLQVVGFVDPDDLLGYHVNDTLKDQPGFFDITHRNATQWLWLFVLPQVAHDNELQKADSRQIILCGATISPDGKVKPRDCS